MKNRLKAILLATGLTVSMLGTCVYAGEASTEAVTEAVTEDAAAEAASEMAEMESEAQAAEASAGSYAAYYDSMKESIPQTLQALSMMTDEQLEQIIDSGQDASTIAMAATWQSVKDDLGSFVEVTSQEVTEENNVITVTSTATYDGVDEGTPVIVTYEYNVRDNTQSLNWEVKYSMGKLMEQAGLNTIMGIAIVFLVLLFLSFLISQIHWIPDLIEGKNREKEAAKAAAAPKAAPAPVPVAEEEEYVDDLELVAVISAAIAASENTSTDGFVVRSIKKANRRKWQNA